MERINHRHGKTARLLSPIACFVLAMGSSTPSLADITNVSSIAQSTLSVDSRIGNVSPPKTRYADAQTITIGDGAPVTELAELSVSEMILAQTYSLAPGYVRSNAQASGDVSRRGEIAGDSLSVTLSGSSRIGAGAGLHRSTLTGEPINTVAQAAATTTTFSKVTFTVNTPSEFKAAGFLEAYGVSTARAWLVNDVSHIVLFDSIATQSEYDPTLPANATAVDVAGSVLPGTYTLWATGQLSDRLEETVASPPNQAAFTEGNAAFAVTLDITPQ